jgi:peptide/nickel transport system ATP-binding protein
MTTPLLEIKNATKIYGGGFFSGGRQVVALQDFNLTIPEKPARIVTIAGESGSGKSTLASLVLGFTPISGGQILFKGHDIGNMTREQRLEYRRHVQAVFQDPYAVYNPFYQVGHIYDMVIRNFNLASSKAEARELVEEALNIVGLQGKEVLHKYPHQLSGGLRQRVMIAMALACGPNLLIADEPTTALDVTIQAQILDLFLQIQDKEKISILFVSHDLGVIAGIAEEVAVMYAGQVVEKVSVYDIFRNPLHPYTKGLLASTPYATGVRRSRRLFTIPGVVPSPASWPEGCRFHNRCRYVLKKCRVEEPPEFSPEAEHNVKCWLFEK